MESTFKNRTECTVNYTSQIVSHCLAKSDILGKIFRHFSNTQLLSLSLVSKRWNYEARCVIRDRESSIANLAASDLPSSSPRRCDLAAFASDLHQMNVVPFCGMKISLDWTSPYSAQPFHMFPTTDTSVHDVIFHRIPFKYFHVVIHASFGGRSDPKLLFVQKVLQDLGEDLEELAITLLPEHDNFFQKLFRAYTFPNLKIFSFDAQDDDDHTEFIKMIVSNAPNLQELCTDWLYIMNDVLEGSSAVLVNCKDFDPFHHQFSDAMVQTLRLRSLSVVEHTPDFNEEKFNRIIPMLLETSQTWLKSLKMNSVFALPIMGYGICLENLTELILYMDCCVDLDFLRGFDVLNVFELLQAFDFTRIFPSLHQVSIESRSSGLELDHLKHFCKQGEDAILDRPIMQDRAVNIKDLSLSECLNSYTATLLPNVFPDIQRLSVRLGDDEKLDISCELIWKHWVGLREIKMEKDGWIRDVPRIPNLDSVFCGIRPEEADELRGKDDGYLERVNIVPVMPAITCLKNLKKFTFVFDWSDWSGTRKHDCFFTREDFNERNFVFSKVSGLVAFARCPDLSVSLETNWPLMEHALSHMKPYASVVLTR